MRLGEDPIQLVPLLVKGLSPGPSPGVKQEPPRWEFAVHCPCHPPTQRPHLPCPRAHTRWLSVSVLPVCHVYQMYAYLHVYMLGSMCLRPSASRTPDCPKSQSQPGHQDKASLWAQSHEAK